MSVDVLTPRQRQAAHARAAFARKFPSPEAKSEYFRAIGERGNAGRVVLRAEEAAALVDASDALVDAYSLLSRIAERARVKLGDAPTEAA